MQIKEDKVEIYRLRNVGISKSNWADIMIDTQEGSECGRIVIISDWGSWKYYWGACGCPFKVFLVELKDTPHYAAQKLGGVKRTKICPRFKEFWEQAFLPFFEPSTKTTLIG